MADDPVAYITQGTGEIAILLGKDPDGNLAVVTNEDCCCESRRCSLKMVYNPPYAGCPECWPSENPPEFTYTDSLGEHTVTALPGGACAEFDIVGSFSGLSLANPEVVSMWMEIDEDGSEGSDSGSGGLRCSTNCVYVYTYRYKYFIFDFDFYIYDPEDCADTTTYPFKVTATLSDGTVLEADQTSGSSYSGSKVVCAGNYVDLSGITPSYDVPSYGTIDTVLPYQCDLPPTVSVSGSDTPTTNCRESATHSAFSSYTIYPNCVTIMMRNLCRGGSAGGRISNLVNDLYTGKFCVPGSDYLESGGQTDACTLAFPEPPDVSALQYANSHTRFGKLVGSGYYRRHFYSDKGSIPASGAAAALNRSGSDDVYTLTTSGMIDDGAGGTLNVDIGDRIAVSVEHTSSGSVKKWVPIASDIPYGEYFEKCDNSDMAGCDFCDYLLLDEYSPADIDVRTIDFSVHGCCLVYDEVTSKNEVELSGAIIFKSMVVDYVLPEWDIRRRFTLTLTSVTTPSTECGSGQGAPCVADPYVQMFFKGISALPVCDDGLRSGDVVGYISVVSATDLNDNVLSRDRLLSDGVIPDIDPMPVVFFNRNPGGSPYLDISMSNPACSSSCLQIEVDDGDCQCPIVIEDMYVYTKCGGKVSPPYHYCGSPLDGHSNIVEFPWCCPERQFEYSSGDRLGGWIQIRGTKQPLGNFVSYGTGGNPVLKLGAAEAMVCIDLVIDGACDDDDRLCCDDSNDGIPLPQTISVKACWTDDCTPLHSGGCKNVQLQKVGLAYSGCFTAPCCSIGMIELYDTDDHDLGRRCLQIGGTWDGSPDPGSGACAKISGNVFPQNGIHLTVFTDGPFYDDSVPQEIRLPTDKFRVTVERQGASATWEDFVGDFGEKDVCGYGMDCDAYPSHLVTATVENISEVESFVEARITDTYCECNRFGAQIVLFKAADVHKVEVNLCDGSCEGYSGSVITFYVREGAEIPPLPCIPQPPPGMDVSFSRFVQTDENGDFVADGWPTVMGNQDIYVEALWKANVTLFAELVPNGDPCGDSTYPFPSHIGGYVWSYDGYKEISFGAILPQSASSARYKWTGDVELGQCNDGLRGEADFIFTGYPTVSGRMPFLPGFSTVYLRNNESATCTFQFAYTMDYSQSPPQCEFQG